jgi:hypothetical protein
VIEEVRVTYLTPVRFAEKPQTGVPIVQEWASFLRWLTSPTSATDKRAAGAWCPAELPDGVVKGGRGPVSLLVADVDDCGPGAIEESARALAPYAGAIVPTFSATREKAKHRIVLVPDRAIAPEEFPLAWTKMARRLAAVGIVVDRGCKNLNRLYFAPVTRSPEAWLGARVLTGEPVFVDVMLAAARDDARSEARTEAARPAPAKTAHSHRYVAAARDRARASVADASPGGRHDVLLREAYALARLGLSQAEIASALLEAFVAIAGEARRREGEHAIRDAVAARQRKGAA